MPVEIAVAQFGPRKGDYRAKRGDDYLGRDNQHGEHQHGEQTIESLAERRAWPVPSFFRTPQIATFLHVSPLTPRLCVKIRPRLNTEH